MAEFFDYNKENGMRYDTECHGDKLIISAKQDIQPVLDHMKDKQEVSDRGIKGGFWHYCSIPTVVEVELRQKGIDIYNKHQTKELLREINTNYPYLKATRRHHE